MVKEMIEDMMKKNKINGIFKSLLKSLGHTADNSPVAKALLIPFVTRGIFHSL